MPSPTIVLLPMWATGHFSSMLEAGKRLLFCSAGRTAAYSLTVLVTPPPMAASSEASSSQQAHCEMMATVDGIVFHHLPAIEHRTDLAHPSEYIRLYAPQVKEAIAGLAAPVAAVVVDFFGTPLLDVAHDLAVPAYVYFASTGAMLALMLRLPGIQEELASRLREEGGVVDVPGMPPVPVASMPSPDVNDYTWFAYYGRRFLETRGIIANTAAELEPGVLASIAGGRCTPGGRAPTVYPIGPVLSPKPRVVVDARSSSAQECIRWLGAQPPASVVFLCFGSMGWMNAEQAREVAAGLERSGHRFLWVLRGPPAGSGSGHPTDANLGDLLPDGFLERTKAQGVVWPGWAPQLEILAHAAVGGFVTHCGWNSVLESLAAGVPMVCVPRMSDQRTNAQLVVREWRVGVRAQVDDGGVLRAAEVRRCIDEAMGNLEAAAEVRRMAAEWKHVVTKAMGKGGSSDRNLMTFVDGARNAV